MRKLKLYLVCIGASISTLCGAFTLEVSSEVSVIMYIVGLIACAYCFVPAIIWTEKKGFKSKRRTRRSREIRRQGEVA